MKPPISPACARPGCRRSDRRPRGIRAGLDPPRQWSWDFNCRTSSTAHSRASCSFAASRKVRAFARAWLSADRSRRSAFPPMLRGQYEGRMTCHAAGYPIVQPGTNLDRLTPSRLASRRDPPALSRTSDPLRAIRPSPARCGSRNALSDAAKRCHPACRRDAKRVSCSRLGLWAAADPRAAIRADPPGNRAPAVGFALERARLGPRELEGGACQNQRH